MIVTKKGYYRFLKDYVTRGSWSVGALKKGAVVYINQINEPYHQCISSSFFDWEYNNLPVEEVKATELLHGRDNANDITTYVIVPKEEYDENIDNDWYSKSIDMDSNKTIYINKVEDR